MKDHYDLFKETDEYLTRPKFSAPRERRFYPSEASVVALDEFGDKVRSEEHTSELQSH